jgi:hypothetical chaperone protein
VGGVERFGLDFGTTNSTLAWARGEAPPHLCEIDAAAADPRVLRSLLYFSLEERAFVVGQRAIDEYLAEDMRGTLIQSIKTFLPDDSFEETLVHDRPWTLEELVSVVFRLVAAAIRHRTSDDEVLLVVGRPAVFVERPEREELARTRLRRAAALAGFTRVAFEYEPIAAGLAYEASLARPEVALIADLGGGTSDFTVMRLGTGRGGDRRADILGTGGVQIGGDTFDARIMAARLVRHFGAGSTYRSPEGKTLPFPSRLLARLGHWHEVPFLRGPRTRDLLGRLAAASSDPEAVVRLGRFIEGNYAFFLFEAIERAKSRLSVADEATVEFHLDGIDIDERLTRAEFDALIADDLARVARCMHGVLDAAGIGTEKVDAVFVTGGSAQIPAVRALFARTFGTARLRTQDFLVTVATGLGRTAATWTAE